MKKPAKASIEVRGTVVNIVTQNEADYICLTDIAITQMRTLLSASSAKRLK